MIILFLVLFNFQQVNASVSPTNQRIVDPYFFGSQFIKLTSVVNNNNVPYSSAQSVYSYVKPLARTYANVTTVQAILSTFAMNTNYFIQYSINVYQTPGPFVSSVNVDFSVGLNSQFLQIGFHIIIVAKPLDLIMKFLQFDISVNTGQTKPFPTSITYLSNQSYSFIKSFKAQFNPLISLNPYFSINTVAKTVTCNWLVVGNAPLATYNTTIKILWIYLDIGQKQLMTQFSTFDYAFTSLSNPFITPGLNFNINKTRFGFNFNNQCLLGFQFLKQVPAAQSYFKFDLDSSLGIINGLQNSMSHTAIGYALCVQVLTCPSTSPYQHSQQALLCLDCSDGIAVTGVNINNCILLNSTFTKQQFLDNGTVFSKCLQCIQCKVNFFLISYKCITCGEVITNCFICNTLLIKCVTCQTGYVVNALTSLCQTCASRLSNCKYCTQDGLICDKCFSGFQNHNGSCQLPKGFQNFISMINVTFKNVGFSSANKAPNSRRFFGAFFGFITNFDDLWLYNYHNRNYDIILESAFSATAQIQRQKWNLMPYQRIWNKGLHFNTSLIQSKLNTKQNFTSPRFLKQQGNGNGFLLNTLNYFLSNFITLIITFMVIRLLFILTKNYKISITFRQYSFSVILILMTNQGNIQYFSYLLGFQLQTLFFNQNIDKILSIQAIFIFFYYIFVTICFYFLILQYKSRFQAKYMFQNLFVSQSSSFYLGMQYGVRNILLGLSHSFFDTHYIVKILLLITIEVGFLFFNIYFLSNSFIKKSMILKFKIWISLIFGSSLRIIVICTFLIENDTPLDSEDGSYLISQLSEFYITFFIIYSLLSLLCVIYGGVYSTHELLNLWRSLKDNKFKEQIINQAKEVKQDKVYEHIFQSNEIKIKKVKKIKISFINGLKIDQKFIAKDQTNDPNKEIQNIQLGNLRPIQRDLKKPQQSQRTKRFSITKNGHKKREIKDKNQIKNQLIIIEQQNEQS